MKTGNVLTMMGPVIHRSPSRKRKNETEKRVKAFRRGNYEEADRMREAKKGGADVRAWGE
jgi:hypothetical protein